VRSTAAINLALPGNIFEVVAAAEEAERLQGGGVEGGEGGVLAEPVELRGNVGFRREQPRKFWEVKDEVIQHVMDTNYVAAIVKLDKFDDDYLYVTRLLDPRVVPQLQATRASVTEYAALESRRIGVQVAFALMYTVIALIVLLSAVWVGLIALVEEDREEALALFRRSAEEGPPHDAPTRAGPESQAIRDRTLRAAAVTGAHARAMSSSLNYRLANRRAHLAPWHDRLATRLVLEQATLRRILADGLIAMADLARGQLRRRRQPGHRADQEGGRRRQVQGEALDRA